MDLAAPQFLNLLRVCDVPEMLGLLAPRPLKIMESKRDESRDRVAAAYRAAGASTQYTRSAMPE
jgi:hypothetical protein